MNVGPSLQVHHTSCRLLTGGHIFLCFPVVEAAGERAGTEEPDRTSPVVGQPRLGGETAGCGRGTARRQRV